MSVTAVPIRPLAKGSVVKLWLALVVLCVAGAALAWIGTARLQIATIDNGVRIQTLRAGTGPLITAADLVLMQYRLTKLDGTFIEDSRQSGQPFVISADRSFPGFGVAMRHMQEGGRYRIWVPPGQHAARFAPGMPFGPQDTLVFDIEVQQVAAGMAAAQQMMGPQGGGLPPGAEGGLPPGALPPGAAGPPGELPPGLESGPPPGAEAPPPAGGTERRRPGGNAL